MSENKFKSVVRIHTDVRADKRSDFLEICRYFCGEPDEMVDQDNYHYSFEERIGKFCPHTPQFISKDGKNNCVALNFDYVLAYEPNYGGEISSINMDMLDRIMKGVIERFENNPFSIKLIDFEILTYTWYNGVDEPFSEIKEE